MEEFIEGKFFDGELYIDMNKETFKAMEFKKMHKTGIISAVMSKASRLAQKRAKDLNLGGDRKGDLFQYGGALVVDQKGKDLYVFKQQTAPEHAENEDLLKALGLSTDNVPHAEDLGSMPGPTKKASE